MPARSAGFARATRPIGAAQVSTRSVHTEQGTGANSKEAVGFARATRPIGAAQVSTRSVHTEQRTGAK